LHIAWDIFYGVEFLKNFVMLLLTLNLAFDPRVLVRLPMHFSGQSFRTSLLQDRHCTYRNFASVTSICWGEVSLKFHKTQDFSVDYYLARAVTHALRGPTHYGPSDLPATSWEGVTGAGASPSDGSSRRKRSNKSWVVCGGQWRNEIWELRTFVFAHPLEGIRGPGFRSADSCYRHVMTKSSWLRCRNTFRYLKSELDRKIPS
jgi:hypothetical protein